MKRREFSGLFAATHTPLRADGEINLDPVGPIVEHLLREGVSGILPCGTTGEGPLLTGDERRAVARAYVQAAGGRLPVIVHVGHSSVEEARALARHAQEIGADALAAVAPFYSKPPSIEILIDCLARIAGGAPDLPLFYYHIPRMTDVSLCMVELLERAATLIPTFAGIKYSAPTIHEFQACVGRASREHTLFFGVDEMLLSGLVAGARGAIGSTYNFAAPLYRRLWEAFERGDMEEASACQARSVELVRVIFKYRNHPAMKAIMSFLGLDCGPCRLPLVPLCIKELAGLERDLQEIGYFDWGRTPVTKRVAHR